MIDQARQAKQAGADLVEVRLDFLAEIPSDADLTQLLTSIPLGVIVTCRPRREGGRFSGDESRRLGLLRAAAKAGAEFLDVEMDVPEQSQPGGQIIRSHHDFSGAGADLEAAAESMDASLSAVNKLAFVAPGPEDALRAFDIIRACNKPTIALAMGEAGVLTRILAPKFDAMGSFASLVKGAESAPGQLTIDELKNLYRWDSINAETFCCGVVGCPVSHSMSPAIHNAAFDQAQVNAVYVPLPVQPGADNFNRFMDALLARPWLNWRGMSVTIPHKENALAYVGSDNCDELARAIGAINTITISPDGSLRGDNTDYAAAIDALCDTMGIVREQLKGRSAAVLGAGGAARAIVAALSHYGAETTVFNRTVSRAESLADEFACKARSIDDAGKIDAEIVINCTPLGMHPNTDACPLAVIPSCVEVVFDTIYNPIETQLLRRARGAGCKTVSGLEMFVRQATAQFEIWTDVPAPRDTMRDVVLHHLDR